MFGKRGVHKDTKLQDEGGTILEKDGVLYNCVLTVCDQGRDMNEYCSRAVVFVIVFGNLHLVTN